MATNAWIELPIEGGGSGSWKDPVATAADLPATGNTPGDARTTEDTGIVYVWNGSVWVAQSGGSIVGPSNTFAGFDGSGNIEGVPGFNIDTTSGGMDEGLTEHPNNGGGASVNSFSVSFEPLQNSPNENWSIQNNQIFLDNASSGFSQGTNGAAVQMANLGITHHGTGDVGGLYFIQSNSDIGNGTDPITVKGMGYMFGFGNIHANVNLDGSLQGYTFQVNVDAAATGTSNFSISAFEDFCNIGIPVEGYTSFGAGPNVAAIANNHGFTGVNISPNITTLTGNAGYTGFGAFGNITTMGATSTLNGFNYSPNVTTSHGNIIGLTINPQILGGDANFLGMRISPYGGGSIGGVEGIDINLSGVTGSDVQGVVGINSDSRIQINATTQLKAAQGFQIGSRLEHLFTVPNGSPVTGTDELAVNIAGDFLVQDNVANGAFGIGFNSVGFIASMGVAATKTVDTITVFLPASALPDPGFTTGGNVTEFHMIRTFPPLPQGGTLNITNLYAFKLDSAFGPFSGAATNAYGLYLDDSGIKNWIGGRTTLGGATFTAAASNAALAVNDAHIQSIQTTSPTVTVDANAGTGATGSVSNATDTAGRLELVTGTAPSAGLQITVVFNKIYATAPIVSLTPANATAATAQSLEQVFVSSATTGFDVNFVNASAGTLTYDWFYQVIETQ